MQEKLARIRSDCILGADWVYWYIWIKGFGFDPVESFVRIKSLGIGFEGSDSIQWNLGFGFGPLLHVLEGFGFIQVGAFGSNLI